MITILPCEGAEKEEILRSLEIKEKEGLEVLQMKDSSCRLGAAVVEEDGTQLNIYAIQIGKERDACLDPQQRFIADSLLRACASFAANRSLPRLVATEGETPFFMEEGFQWEENKYSLPTDRIVKICKDS